jgi:hypothetical protein
MPVNCHSWDLGAGALTAGACAMATTSSNVHGVHQEVHLGIFKTDRYGVLTGTTRREVHEAFDAPRWELLLPSAAPEVVPVPCSGVQRDYESEKKLAIYTYTHEGLVAGDVSFEDRVFCSLEGTDTEEPIETHPEFEAIFKKYKGRNEPGTTRFGYFEKMIELEGKKQFNPLYGVTHFLSYGLIWTRTFVARSLPAGLLSRVDCIDKPEGHGGMQPPALKGRRNWLQIAPVAQQRGSAIQIAQRWMASGKNGWNGDIYGQRHAAGA